MNTDPSSPSSPSFTPLAHRRCSPIPPPTAIHTSHRLPAAPVPPPSICPSSPSLTGPTSSVNHDEVYNVIGTIYSGSSTFVTRARYFLLFY